MKKLFFYLLTANFSGTAVSLIIFLVNTYFLEIHEYLLYSFINSALIIAGAFVLYGTDNLALASYEKHPTHLVYNNVKRIKFRMLFLGLLIFLGSCLYFTYTNSQNIFSLVLICFFVSLPFLFSFYHTDTHFYIHSKVYDKFVKTNILIRIICLLPILIAAFSNRYLLITTLTANSISVIVPALKFKRELSKSSQKIEIEKKVFSSSQLFENFVLNSFPIIYINAAFFLFNSIGSAFIDNSAIVYTSRIYIILASIASSVISVVISSNVRETTLIINKLGKILYIVAAIFLIMPFLVRYALNLEEPYKFIGWSVFELGVVVCFFILFFINVYNNKYGRLFVTGLFAFTICFFLFAKLTIKGLEALMFERTIFASILIFVNVLLVNKNKLEPYEKTSDN